MPILSYAVAVTVPLGLVFAMSGVLRRSNPLLRLRGYRDYPAPADLVPDLRAAELRIPFGQRVVRPLLHQVGSLLVRGTPGSQTVRLTRMLAHTDGFWSLTAASFIGLQLLLVVAGVVVCAVAGVTVLGFSGGTLGAFILAGGLGGYALPRFRLSAAVKSRRRDLVKSLPAANDLLIISLEAGLTVDGALQQVVAKYQNPLAREFATVLNEVSLGRSRRDALMAMQERVEVREVTAFVTALVQADRLGISLSRTLRIQAVEMRRKRRQRAEELGAKAPLKMLFPLVGCIFPTLFIVLLGPAGLVIYHQVMGR